MLLNALNVKKEYGIQTVLDIEKLEIRDGDRIGLIGRNGAGKSTLLGVLSGRIACDEGVVKRYCPIAEILQTGETEDEPEARLLSQLKLRDSAVKSGGEKTRRAIGAAFSSQAPLLFADWTAQKERERGFQEFEYQQYQKEKKRLERTTDALQRKSQTMTKPPKRMGSSEWILYKGVAAVQQGHVQSNKTAVMSRLEHLEKKERPDELPQVSMKLPDAGKIRAKNAAAIRHLTVSYGERIVLDNVSLEIEAGRRTFITGNNGAGKSTLIKALIDRAPETFITSEARVAYFSQDLDTLDPKKTVLENVSEDAVYPQHICRAVLSNLYMTKDDMFKPVSVLSGGEKVKTALAKVLVSGCNFMILDEPTNHMDVYTMEGLEHLLESYDGTLLAISHDRTFISHTGDVVFRLEHGDIQKSTEQ